MVNILTCKNVKNGRDEIILVRDKNFIHLQKEEMEKLAKFFFARLNSKEDIQINYVDLTNLINDE